MTNKKQSLTPDAAIRRLIAEPESLDALEAAGDALAKVGRFFDAKSIYSTYLEHSANEVIEEKLRRLNINDTNRRINRERYQDDRFVFDPECAVEFAVIAATE